MLQGQLLRGLNYKGDRASISKWEFWFPENKNRGCLALSLWFKCTQDLAEKLNFKFLNTKHQRDFSDCMEHLFHIHLCFNKMLCKFKGRTDWCYCWAQCSGWTWKIHNCFPMGTFLPQILFYWKVQHQYPWHLM